jgi:putative flippase GtrA
LIERIVRFGAVGAIGFVVDAAVLLLLANTIGLPPLFARILSFLVAATVTFSLNWRFTFLLAGKFALSRLTSYWLTTAVGACVNVLIFRYWLERTDVSTRNLVLGTAFGSVAAMFLNYAVSSRFVFKNNADSGHDSSSP